MKKATRKIAKRRVGAFEAKTHLPQLLKEVSRGARITITKHGEAIAELVPVTERNEESIQAAIDSLKKYRQGITWGLGLSTESARKEGRK